MKFLAEVLLGAVAALLVFGAILLLEGCGGTAFEEELFNTLDADAGESVDATADGASAYDGPWNAVADQTARLPEDAGSDSPDMPVPPREAGCPLHTDGFGDSFTSCEVDSEALARAACAAGTPATASWPCANIDTSTCIDTNAHAIRTTFGLDAGCRQWGWAGDAAGFVYTSCGCPTNPAGSWR